MLKNQYKKLVISGISVIALIFAVNNGAFAQATAQTASSSSSGGGACGGDGFKQLKTTGGALKEEVAAKATSTSIKGGSGPSADTTADENLTEDDLDNQGQEVAEEETAEVLKRVEETKKPEFEQTKKPEENFGNWVKDCLGDISIDARFPDFKKFDLAGWLKKKACEMLGQAKSTAQSTVQGKIDETVPNTGNVDLGNDLANDAKGQAVGEKTKTLSTQQLPSNNSAKRMLNLTR